ncbi:polyketide synthase dehydratase domain-containing protein, partial [Chamaesiphon sp. OTE_75_metabat_556]|uniref:polyketide synthase dehydratase domain-containing protein n=1 Tax=Chamaesiphon sp. OTE_75_metabat_556 TaxID=2964692 RepID=UPI00286AA893
MPTYPFQRERYWIEEEKNDRPVDRKQLSSTYESLHPLIDRRLHLAGLENQIRFECILSADRPTYLKDHYVFSQPIFPAAGYLEIVLAAGATLFNSASLILEDVALQQALILSDEIVTVQVILTPQTDLTYSFQIFSLDLDEQSSSPQWTLHVRGKLLAGDKDTQPETTDLATLKANYTQQISPQDFYQDFKDRGIDYGSSFQAVRQLWRNGEKALGQIQLPEILVTESTKYQLHPVLLDASFQVLAAALDLTENRDIYLPIAIERLKFYRTVPHQLWTEVEIGKPTAHPQTLTGEIRLLNEQGLVVAEIEGLTLFRTSPQALVKTIEPDIDNWLYQVHWQPQAATPHIQLIQPTNPGSWLLFAPSTEIGQDLVESLNQQGQQPILVTPGADYQQLAPQHYQVDPIDGSDFLRLLTESLEHQPPLCGIVHLWSLSETLAPPQSAQELQTAQELGCASVLHLIQALGASQNLAIPQLWLVTQGTQSVGNESLPTQFQQAPLWGLGGVIALEQPQLQCRRIDLDPNVTVAPAMSVLLPELLSSDVEDRIAYRQGVRHLARLVRHQEIPTLMGKLPIPRQPFQLKLSAYGMLDNLSLQPLQSRPPGGQEVEIQVRAVGLNFRDVLNTLGVLKDYYAEHMGIASAEQLTFGFECAGTIVAVGAGVAHLQVGDEVMATMLTDAFSSFITTRAEFVVPQPSQISS